MKFKNKYRIESARLRFWDYASSGWYFVTVCTKNKENFFGDVNAVYKVKMETRHLGGDHQPI